MKRNNEKQQSISGFYKITIVMKTIGTVYENNF